MFDSYGVSPQSLYYLNHVRSCACSPSGDRGGGWHSSQPHTIGFPGGWGSGMMTGNLLRDAVLCGVFGLVDFLFTPGLSAWTVVVGFLPLMALTAPAIVRNPFFFVSLAFTLPRVAGNFLGLPEANGPGPFNTHGPRQLPLPADLRRVPDISAPSTLFPFQVFEQPTCAMSEEGLAPLDSLTDDGTAAPILSVLAPEPAYALAGACFGCVFLRLLYIALAYSFPN